MDIEKEGWPPVASDDHAQNVHAEADLQDSMKDVKPYLKKLRTSGIGFFPCKLNKIPDTGGKSWKGYGKENGFGIFQALDRMKDGGMVGGELPEGLIVVDIDRHVKPDGFESFKNIGISIDDLKAKTMAVATGGGGLHLYYTIDEPHPPIKSHPLASVDIKAHGGYVILGGSPGYTPLNNFEPQPLPDELKIHIFKQDNEPAKSEKPKPSTEQLKKLLIDPRLDPGQHFPDYESWFGFCQRLTATFGSDFKTLEVIATWSALDEKYNNPESWKENWKTLSTIDKYNGDFHAGSLSHGLIQI